MVPNKHWIGEETASELRKYFERSENKNTTYMNEVQEK